MKTAKEWAEEFGPEIQKRNVYFYDYASDNGGSGALTESRIRLIQEDAIQSIQADLFEAFAMVAERHWMKCDDVPMPDFPEMIRKLKEQLR